MKIASFASLLLLSASQIQSKLMFETPGKDCPDIYRNSWDIAQAEIEHCQVYKTSNACNRFELSESGEVLSCEVGDICIAVMTDPKCLKKYDSYAAVSLINMSGLLY